MRKVLIIFDTPFPQVVGGGQRRLYELSKKIPEFSFAWFSFYAGIVEKNHINYLPGSKIPQMYSENGARNAKEPILFTMTCFANFKNFIKYDVWWVGQWPLLHLPLLILVGTFFKKKIIIDWWEVWSFSNWVSYNKFFGLIGFFLQLSTLSLIKILGIAVVTDNNKDYSLLRKRLGDRVSISMVPNGIDDRWQSNPNVCPVNECIYDIAILGRLKNHKGVDLLLDAVGICKSRGISLRVAIIGDGPERNNLLLQADKLEISDNVKFFGEIPFEHLKSVLENSKFFTLTTHNGGGGNLSILDAYGAGLPVICFESKSGVDISLVKPDLTGVIVKEVDSLSLAEAIEKLYLNNLLLNEMRSNVRKEKNALTWDILAKHYKNLFG